MECINRKVNEWMKVRVACWDMDMTDMDLGKVMKCKGCVLLERKLTILDEKKSECKMTLNQNCAHATEQNKSRAKCHNAVAKERMHCYVFRVDRIGL